MEKNNCLRCNFRHTDNGNCTAVGGFCTAVTAAHCPLLRDFLDTGLTPDEIRNMSGEWCAAMSVLNGMGSYDRLRELADADKDGRVALLPCKVGDTVWVTDARVIGRWMPEQLSQPDAAVILRTYIDKDGKYLFETERYTFERGIIGKAVFLTREEAERAMEGNG